MRGGEFRIRRGWSEPNPRIIGDTPTQNIVQQASIAGSRGLHYESSLRGTSLKKTSLGDPVPRIAILRPLHFRLPGFRLPGLWRRGFRRETFREATERAR